jgi:hypothetical protein
VISLAPQDRVEVSGAKRDALGRQLPQASRRNSSGALCDMERITLRRTPKTRRARRWLSW